jgi:hypothetical protein
MNIKDSKVENAFIVSPSPWPVAIRETGGILSGKDEHYKPCGTNLLNGTAESLREQYAATITIKQLKKKLIKD